MDFALLPPEINSIRMYTGPGSGPLLAAAAAWDSLAAELGAAAGAYRSVLTGLTGQWLGVASTAMSAAAAPYVAWMDTTSTQAEQAATQAKAAAAAYETAFAATVSPPVIATNRAQLAALVATNVLGQNTAAIAVAEGHYIEMWAQDAAAMYAYVASSAAATALTPFSAPDPNTDPAGLDNQSVSVAQATGSAATSRLSNALTQALQGFSPGLATGGTNAGVQGLAMDELGLGIDTLGLAGMEAPGLGTEFAGLGIEFGGLGIEMAPQLGLGALGGLGLIGDLSPVAGVSLVSGPMGGLGAVGAAGATWAGMGEAASLGSLTVPQAWTAAAPPALREIALMSAQSSLPALPAVTGAGASQVPFAEMALAGMAGRAMSGSSARSFKEWTGFTAWEHSAPPPEQPESTDHAVTGVELVTALRGLAELRDSGILTEEEFNQQKQRLLDG